MLKGILYFSGNPIDMGLGYFSSYIFLCSPHNTTSHPSTLYHSPTPQKKNLLAYSTTLSSLLKHDTFLPVSRIPICGMLPSL